MITEYQSNSHRSKDEAKNSEVVEKRVERVVTGPVKTKKKNEVRKFMDIFISEDVSSVKSHIFTEVFVPAFKKAISDAVTNGIDMLLYGETGRTKKSTPASKISYRSYYDQQNGRQANVSRTRSVYDYDDVIIPTRGDAEEVLDRMFEALSKYGEVSVADFYELVGITGNWTDNKYGWTDLRNASIVRVRDGYVIKLPRAQAL